MFLFVLDCKPGNIEVDVADGYLYAACQEGSLNGAYKTRLDGSDSGAVLQSTSQYTWVQALALNWAAGILNSFTISFVCFYCIFTLESEQAYCFNINSIII